MFEQRYKSSIVEGLQKYLSMVETYVNDRISSEGVKPIHLSGMKVLPEDQRTLNDYVTEGDTACIEIEVYFTIGQEVTTHKLFIPALLENGIFIVKGHMKTPSATLENKRTLALYNDNLTLKPGVVINFKRIDETWDVENLVFTYYEDDQKTELNEETFEKVLAEKVWSKDFVEAITLTDEQKMMLSIKFDEPLETIPPTWSPDLIRAVIAQGRNLREDNIIDKCIMSTGSDLISKLFNYKSNKIRQSIKNSYFKYGSISLSTIQGFVSQYFTGMDSELGKSDIESPVPLNVMAVSAVANKITLPSYLSYSSSFCDIIDIANTPENGNVNVINSLNVCASYKGDQIYIDCYNLKGEKINVNYLKYLCSVVVRNFEYDYDEKRLSPKDELSVHCQLRQHEKLYTKSQLESLSDVLVEPQPDEMLSLETRNIPMVNMSDSVRIFMGNSMQKQAIECVGSEPARVWTGNNDSMKSTLVQRYDLDEPAEVTRISDTAVYFKTESGIESSVAKPKVMHSMNDSVVTFNSDVKVGQILHKGDIISKPSTVTHENGLGLGLNARAIYMNYFGFTHEDSIVISESFSKRLAVYRLIEVVKPVSTRLNYIVDAKRVGDVVSSDDYLMKLKADTSSGSDKERRTLPDFKVPNNIDKGIIIGVSYEVKPDLYRDAPERYQEYADWGEKLQTPTDDGITNLASVPDKYKDVVPPVVDKNWKVGETFHVTYQILSYCPAGPGDKLTGRYGNKGEIALVLPDDLMPRIVAEGDDVEDGDPADILLSPASVVARKNSSQLVECLIAKIADKMWESVVTNPDAKNPETWMSVAEETKPLFGSKFTKVDYPTWLQMIDRAEYWNVATGAFCKFKLEDIFKLAEKYGVQETEEIFIPDVIIGNDSKNGRKAYDPEKYQLSRIANGKLYEGGFCEQKSITGETYIYRLYHSAAYTAKVAAGADNRSTYQPVMGRTLLRGSEGACIGEMEQWSLASWGTTGITKAANKSKVIENQYQFLMNLLLMGNKLDV